MLNIDNQVAFTRWGRQRLLDSLERHQVWLARQSHVVYGYIIFSDVLDEAELLNIAVNPEHQGQGIGTKLLQYGLWQLKQQRIRSCFLEVAVNNQPAISLYEKIGFLPISTRKGYYKIDNQQTDAWVMQYTL